MSSIEPEFNKTSFSQFRKQWRRKAEAEHFYNSYTETIF